MLKGKLLIEHCWLSWFYSNLIDRLWNVFLKINLDQKMWIYRYILYILYAYMHIQLWCTCQSIFDKFYSRKNVFSFCKRKLKLLVFNIYLYIHITSWWCCFQCATVLFYFFVNFVSFCFSLTSLNQHPVPFSSIHSL